MWLTGEQQRVWRNYLAMISRVQEALNHQLQSDSCLSLADYDILVALDELCPVRVNELAATLGWEQSRLSHQLRRMRDRGLVTRAGTDDDRRGATVDLADSGRAALAAAAPGHAELVRSVMFDGSSEDALRALDVVTTGVLGRLAT